MERLHPNYNRTLLSEATEGPCVGFLSAPSRQPWEGAKWGPSAPGVTTDIAQGRQ